jgi:hypothetical protein
MMAMLLMTGQLLNVFRTVTGVNKSGEAFGGKDKIQILGAETLQNGETQNKLIDLSCSDVSAFDRYMGQVITFPVGVIPSGKQVIFFVPRGARPVAPDGGKPEQFGGESAV